MEADIAWRQDVGNMTANFTGSLRLLVGLGWPMIFFVSSWASRRTSGHGRISQKVCWAYIAASGSDSPCGSRSW